MKEQNFTLPVAIGTDFALCGERGLKDLREVGIFATDPDFALCGERGLKDRIEGLPALCPLFRSLWRAWIESLGFATLLYTITISLSVESVD